MNSAAHRSTASRRTTLFASALATLASVLALPAAGQLTSDPYPDPIPRSEGVIRVDYVEFVQVPDFEGRPPRMMHLAGEPGGDRMFVNDMWGILYRISNGGETVTEYLDLTDSDWGFSLDARSGERGFQSFAFHPQFSDAGTQGYGKLYTYLDVVDTSPEGDFTAPGNQVTHHTLLLEWTAANPEADAYDGEGPRELMRFAQPFANHNAGQLGFNPLASPGDSDFGLLYMGVADGGTVGTRWTSRRIWAWPSGRSSASIPSARPARTESMAFRRTTPSPSTEIRRRWRNLRLWRPEPATARVGSGQRQPLHVGHRSEHDRGAEHRDPRSQPRLERLGGKLPVHRP